ncbi:DUF6531 domain-containing protein, partial [Paraglaciecola sp.]|uniref:DUF6531 domain-containing protein n=1 Tax=Paraglaciecola sp. TaxID=1920173 RepID=UPI0030F3AD07
MNIRNFNRIASLMLVMLCVNLPQTAFALEGNISFSAQPDNNTNLEQQPGFIRAIMSPVTPKESEMAILARQSTPGLITLDSEIQTTTVEMTSSSASAPSGPASISELARALRNNPDLIYEYVRNNIEYYPVWGVNKGPVGTILDNYGTAFDQASLMVALLRQAGFTASYVKGQINLTDVQVRDWLGINTNDTCAVIKLLSQGQVPIASVTATAAGNCPGSAVALSSIKIAHVWVKVNIGGTNYVFDPSFKPHTLKTAINVSTASGYNASNYLSTAKSGATVTADYVQGINRVNIVNTLNAYGTNLTNYLRSNLPSGELIDVLGGKVINPYTGPSLRQTDLPYRDTSVATTEWATDIPANYRPTMRIQYQGIDKTFTSDAIYGKRLTITYNTSNQPMLKLDGVTQATGTAIAAGTNANVTFNIVHGAYALTGANQSFTQSVKAGGTYLISNGWGAVGRGLVERYRTALDNAKAAGDVDSSETVLGSSLAVLSATWIAQSQQAGFINDRLSNTNTLYHHQVGIAGYNTAAYVDLPGNVLGLTSQNSDTAKESAAFFNSAMHASIFESTAVQQVTGVSAVSTVKLIDIAVTNNYRIYDAKSSNFVSQVQPNLVSCSTNMATFQAAVTAGRRLILPSRCNLTESSWSGVGYFNISTAANSIGALINGGMLGGFSSTTQPVAQTVTNTQKNATSTTWLTQSTGSVFGDPIDMTKGHYLYTHNDITTGIDDFPKSLSFQRLYSSGMRTQVGPLGKGWTHNLVSSATMSSDGFQSLGEDSALDAVNSIVEMMVSLDLLSDVAKPLDKIVIATLGQNWFGQQLINNTVIVKQGLNGEVFTKLPDSTYNAPPSSSAKLTKNADNTYSYEALNRAKLAFNSTGKVATYTTPSGVQAKFTYTGNDLTKVENSLGRNLILTNTSGRVTQVADGTRNVKFVYDTNGNLTTFTDATAKNTTFQYDIPGRMSKLFYPSFPTVAFLTNVYDSLGRVQTQTNANGQLYTYYFAGSRSEEVGPGSVSRVSYVNGAGKVLKEIDPLGRITLNSYDGQSRLVSKVMPEGNSVNYVYDDAQCALQKRCTHNIKTVNVVPKTGSGLTTLTTTLTYESSFNRVATALDPKGQTTTYTYTPQGNPLEVKQPAVFSVPDNTNINPTTTFAYISYTPTGFPTFYLISSETSKIAGNSSVITSTTYKTTNKYVPDQVIVDSGASGLALRTTFTYDTFGNLITEDGPRTDVSDVTNYLYDAERRVVQATNALSKVTKLAYDADGRNVQSAAQIGTQWLVSCNTYTNTGKVLKSWGPGLTSSATTCPTAAAPIAVTSYTYDSLDRVQLVTESLTAAEGGNRVSETTYNANNSVASIKRGVGSTLAQTYATYTYTPNGFPATVKDARNFMTTYEYDGHDRKLKTRYPDKITANVSSTTDYEQYTYDNNSNAISQRLRSGQTITLAYDNVNRLLSRTYPTAVENVTFKYDLLGRVIQKLASNNSLNSVYYSWDRVGRLTSMYSTDINSLNMGSDLSSTRFEYDAASNLTRTTYPGYLGAPA